MYISPSIRIEVDEHIAGEKLFPECVGPVSPVSSSTVKSASIFPCAMSSAASTALRGHPEPLSAPSVVPLALTQSPSMIVSMGSFSKSNVTPEFFAQTYPHGTGKTTVGTSSFPSVAGLVMRMCQLCPVLHPGVDSQNQPE